MTTTTTGTARAVAYHTHQATNGIATVAGHIAKLREMEADPARRTDYRDLLTALGRLSGTVRRLATEATA